MRANNGAKGKDFFRQFCCGVSNLVGASWAFSAACFLILAWAATGPIFHFSDTWQLVINTGTTIITFLMVFLIQNTQNRDTEALQIKLDELIRAMKGAQNVVLDLEELDDKDLEEFRKDYLKLAEAARREMKRKKQKR